MIAIALGAVSFIIWCYLVFARGGFWIIKNPTSRKKHETWGTRAPNRLDSGDLATKSIVVIIPARDEAWVVGRAIESLLAQDYPGPLRIFLADDESSDGTADVARQAAERAGYSNRLTIVRTGSRPAGWTGKLWAVSEGIRAARGFPADYYLLTDADVVHDPGNVKELLARAQRVGYDLVSLMVELHCQALAERALIPAFVFFFFMLYPPSWVQRSSKKTAAAAGGCILIQCAALEGIGGIAAIRGELIDDCALASKVKQHGCRIWLGVSAKTKSLREYHSWKEVRRMISRSAFTQLRHSALLLGLTCFGMLITFVAPCILALAGGIASALGVGAWMLMSLAFLPTLRLYRRSVLWAPLLPVIALFYMAATLDSAVSYWRGRGGVWKGRVQDPGHSPL